MTSHCVCLLPPTETLLLFVQTFSVKYTITSIDARPDDRCDMRSSWIITDYRLSRTRSISADEMYTTICIEWAADHFGLILRYKSIHFSQKYAR